MNENYLLHNETAKKLYFEYAKDLPIISLCSQNEPSDKVYNNIAEAFLLNDCYKLAAMRDCAIDEKFITGDASDYEKFKMFCTILPKFVGHPIYLLSHIELKKHFDCDLCICEDNCDTLWVSINNQIINKQISEAKLLRKDEITIFPVLELDWHDILLFDKNVIDLRTLEERISELIRVANGNGVRGLLVDSLSGYKKPNPYDADIIAKQIKAEEMISASDYFLLETQIYRDLGEGLIDYGWYIFWNGNNNIRAIEYLEDAKLLPINYEFIMWDESHTEEYLLNKLFEWSKFYPIGSLKLAHYPHCFASLCAHADYFRRTLCDMLGKLVENGEYTSDEKTLKKLIEDILYNNLKEAIS